MENLNLGTERQEEFGRLLDVAVDALLDAILLTYPDDLPDEKKPLTQEEFKILLLEAARNRITEAAAGLLIQDMPITVLRYLTERRAKDGA